MSIVPLVLPAVLVVNATVTLRIDIKKDGRFRLLVRG